MIKYFKTIYSFIKSIFINSDYYYEYLSDFSNMWNAKPNSIYCNVDYRGKITKNTLWDFTKADMSKITTGEYRDIANVAAKFAHLREGGKAALVLPKDLSYGLGRMFETFSEIENIPYEIRSFRGIDEAREWLCF